MTLTSFNYNALVSAALFLLYVTLYYISDWICGNESVAGIASLYFFPACVRLLGFLLIEYWVIPALFVAGLICVDLGLDGSGKFVVSAFIAVGGPLGVFIFSQICSLKPTLSNLTPYRLLWLSAGCSLGNSIFYHIGLNFVGITQSTPFGHLSVFIGDMIGTWVMIYLIKIMVTIGIKLRSER